MVLNVFRFESTMYILHIPMIAPTLTDFYHTTSEMESS